MPAVAEAIHTMPIYSFDALKKRPLEVKARAREEVVHITEHGNGAFVFCSEEVLETALEQAREEAALNARIAAAIERGRADMAAGRYIVGTEAAFAEIERRAALYGMEVEAQ